MSFKLEEQQAEEVRVSGKEGRVIILPEQKRPRKGSKEDIDLMEKGSKEIMPQTFG